ncbi:hypothetical protein ACFXHA_39560 [Nocardia sp. NPDC059240]|uniref:hypothetical protein n=1 Tax=Nocardia sp. NPDC059240 TaxID=3346786 RepID=UPI0036782F74
MMTKGVFVWATAGAALLLAGCGGSDQSTRSDGPPTTVQDQLVLSGSEFPSGTTMRNVTSESVRANLTAVGDTMTNSTVTPAECKGPQLDLSAAAKDVLGESAFAVASSNDMRVMYIDYVSSQVMDLKQLVENYAKCPEVQVSATVGNMQNDSTTKLVKLTVPADLSGTDAVAYSSTSTTGGGSPIPRTTYEGFATLRGLTVGVRITGLAAGSAPDPATFDTFFTAAVRKVQDAK